jgi:adenine-specific DNA-methyltransferase
VDSLNYKEQTVSIINKENQMDVILSDLTRERVRSTFMEDFRAFMEESVPENRREFDWHDPTYDPAGMYVIDYYNTKTGVIESGGNEKIALWMLDTDYDGRSLFPKQVFFPMSGEKDGWARLAKNLKAEINPDLIEAYRGTISLPFELGDYQRIAVKIVDDRGIESLKIQEVKE